MNPDLSLTQGGSALEPTPQNLGAYAVYVILVLCTAPFPIASRTGHYAVFCMAYGLCVLLPLGAVLFRLRWPFLRRVLAHPAFWLVCFSFLAWYGQVHFLRLVLPRPNELTAAPALMLPAHNMVHGIDPYAVHLAGGAPVSPGPGWILLLAPLTLAKGAGLLTALGMLLVGYLLSQRSRVAVGIFCLLTVLQPDLVWTSIWGTDLFLIPLAFAALCLLVARYAQSTTAICLLGCAAGIVAQSRLPMLLLVVVPAVGLWRIHRRNARFFVASALLVFAMVGGFFYLWTVRDHLFFQPLHVLHRGRRSGLFFSIIGPLSSLVVLFWIFRRMSGHVRDWLFASAALMFALFLPVGVGELTTRWPNMASWEGANYVSFGLSLLVAALALGGTSAPPLHPVQARDRA